MCQIEGGTPGPSSSGKTIYGAVLDISTTSTTGLVLNKGPLADLVLYVSRPHSKFWKVHLGSEKPVETLAPAVDTVPTMKDEGVLASSTLCGKLTMVASGMSFFSWTPTGGLYLISMKDGQARCIWKEGIVDLSVSHVKALSLAVIYLT